MIGKLFTAITAVRRRVTSPAGQVALAGALLTFGVQIIEGLLSDLVDQPEIRRTEERLLRGHIGHVQLAVAAVDSRLQTVEAKLFGDAKLPDDVEAWPVGKRVEEPAEPASEET